MNCRREHTSSPSWKESRRWLWCLMALLPLFLQTTPVAADAPAPNRGTVRFEVRFMEDMIDHHAMATEMAQLCVTKATHEEARALHADDR